MTAPSFLVVGQGSIGQRHARLLRARGHVSVVSAKAQGAYRSIGEAIRASPPSHVVLANVTSRHADAVLELAAAGFKGTLLIEKPICNTSTDISEIQDALMHFERVLVGYNLRFHAVVQALKSALSGEKIFEARFAVGQLLSTWRPDVSYTASSSAQTASGGGVLRDLSHEIDLILSLLGDCAQLVSCGGNLGRLGIETDEAWSIIMKMASGAMVTLTLNYFDQPARREIAITTSAHTLKADLIAGKLMKAGMTEAYDVARDETYRLLHEEFVKGGQTACSAQEGFAVMRVIEAVERSAREQRWITI